MAETKIRTKIILRNDTANNWTSVASTIILKRGEPAVEFLTDGSIKLKIGDGTSVYANLPYVADSENVLSEEQINSLIQAATIDATKINGVVAEASKVTNKLTAGSKAFDGSTGVEITAADLGALTSIPKATNNAIGGILTGYIDNGDNKAVKLDENGNAYVTISEPLAYTAGDGLALINNQFSVKADGILTTMIKDGQVTDDKIANVNVNKLIQTDGDTLIIDGGIASDN